MLDELERQLETQVRELRQVMGALRPPVLDQRGLEAALHHHVKEFETEHGIAADLTVERPTDDLASEVETVLYASPRRRCPTSASMPAPTTPG
jgi:signal transduction histidine kinase